MEEERDRAKMSAQSLFIDCGDGGVGLPFSPSLHTLSIDGRHDIDASGLKSLCFFSRIVEGRLSDGVGMLEVWKLREGSLSECKLGVAAAGALHRLF